MQWLIDIVLESLKGIIVAWSGSFENIPKGWALCDGTQGTPNLSDRFILGTIEDDSIGITGGTHQHTHDFVGDGHVHYFGSGTGGYLGGEKDRDDRTLTSAAVGETDQTNHEPPYMNLAFIMKL